ncbi:hypothetical protein A7979_05005 [Rothia nasimurium]|uniref:Uncharacterized protein n=1 Tax=Rothia nasimurium TaxID=85336 RepID=A0A1Y1RP47_9MICC|nr:hypothetical protein A7979_05005 [Rothia nasimurium]
MSKADSGAENLLNINVEQAFLMSYAVSSSTYLVDSMGDEIRIGVLVRKGIFDTFIPEFNLRIAYSLLVAAQIPWIGRVSSISRIG